MGATEGPAKDNSEIEYEKMLNRPLGFAKILQKTRGGQREL